MQQSMKVGVYDWTEFGTSDDFYPPDIPEEWKLTYFSNEFESACLSLQSLSTNYDLLEKWCEDLSHSFELSFFLNHVDQLQLLAELRQQVPVSIRYLVVKSSESDILLQINSLHSVLFAAGIDTSDRIIATEDIWRPDKESRPDSVIALFPVSNSMRQYREWIDAWLQPRMSGCREQNLTLWLPGNKTGNRLLSECRTLVEMMGY